MHGQRVGLGKCLPNNNGASPLPCTNTHNNARGEYMTWEIVTGIIALVGFVVTVATVTSKYSGVMAKLEATLTALNETLEELKENNRASHKDIYNKLGDHDKRISKLEVYHDK